MSLKLLDPTLDITFKLLLLRDQALLRDMIEAVLDLPAPLLELKVLNPEIPKNFPADKAIVLDIRARLHDGRQVDLEMQSTFPPGTRARFQSPISLDFPPVRGPYPGALRSRHQVSRPGTPQSPFGQPRPTS